MIVFGVICAKVENAGNEPGVICSNVYADCRGRAAIRITLEGGAIYGMLVSNTTLSGNFSIELILMTGRLMLPRTGSAFGSGRKPIHGQQPQDESAADETKIFHQGHMAVSSADDH